MLNTINDSSMRNMLWRFLLTGLLIVLSGGASVLLAQSAIPQDADHRIDLETAVLLTNSSQESSVAGAIRAETFDKEALLALLNQPGCEGLRIYHGTGAGGERVLVLVGIDVEGKDMYLGMLEEKGFPCPPICDETSPLNGQ